jgi:hypothetical protein
MFKYTWAVCLGLMFNVQGEDGINLFDMDFSNVDFGKVQECEPVVVRGENIDDQDLKIAASTIAQCIQQPLWKSTRAPEGRDILYHIPYKIAAIEYGGFAGNVFFNMTNRMNASAESLLAQFEGQNLKNLEALVDLFLGDLFDANDQNELSSVIPLMGEITIQERKFGALLQGGFIKGPFTAQMHTSLQVAERNFYISKRRQDEIRALFAKQSQGGEFNESELYRFRFGMGDTRLKLGINTLNMADFQNDVGFEWIIPTSRLSQSQRVKADPGRIINDSSTNEALQKGIIDVLRGIRDYLVDPTLGNSGHFGFGCYMESKIDMFHRLMQLWVRMSYDQLFPGTEDRLFMYKQTITPAELERVTKFGTMQKVREALQQYIQQYILPTAFKSEVYPGGVFNLVLALSTEINKMKFAIGYDFYVQQKESIRKLYNTNVSLFDLRVEDTQAARVEQHKIFAEAMYEKQYKRCDLGIGLGGDAAIFSRGIGDDWTVYFKIATSF